MGFYEARGPLTAAPPLSPCVKSRMLRTCLAQENSLARFSPTPIIRFDSSADAAIRFTRFANSSAENREK